MTPEVVVGVDAKILMQAVPVELLKVRLNDGHGQVVDGYVLVDEMEVRLIEPKAIGRPLQSWAAKAVQSRLRRMKVAAAFPGTSVDDLQAKPGDITKPGNIG